MTDKRIEDNLIQQPSAEQILNFLVSNGSINLDGVKDDMEQSRKAKILDNYIGKIGKLNGKTDKRYYIRLKDETKKDGRTTLKANTKEELLDKIYAWHMKHSNEILPDEVTLENLFPEFLEHKKRTTWSDSTLVKNLSIWRNHYEGTEITRMPIRTIRLKHLQEWAYGLIKAHDLTRKEFANVCTWIKQMLEYAEQEELIDKNPYRLLKITNLNVFRQIETKPDENRVLSPEMELALYQKCWDLYSKEHYPVNRTIPLAIILLFQAGLRPCEVCSLRYADIVDGELVVKRYYSEKEDLVRENRTKAGHGPRRIPLTNLAQGIIRTIREDCEEEPQEGDYIFVIDEQQMHGFYNRMRKTFPLICKDLGIPDNTLYAGRRTFVSSLLDDNVNIKTIQNYVGHKDAKTTLNHYCFDRSGKQHRIEQLENARLGLSLADVIPDESKSVPTVPKSEAI